MDIVRGILMALFLLDSLALTGLILMQMSKHGNLGGAFGGGGTHTVFGREERPDARRTATAWLAVGFLALALSLSMI